jgi:hypothetical protein
MTIALAAPHHGGRVRMLYRNIFVQASRVTMQRHQQNFLRDVEPVGRPPQRLVVSFDFTFQL